MNAQRFVKNWIASAHEEYSIIPTEHLRTVFHALTEQTPRINSKEFSKRLGRNGLAKVRKRELNAGRDSNAIRGIEIKWQVEEDIQRELVNTYFSDKDKQALTA